MSIKVYKGLKIIIGCRTDFVQRQGEDDLEDFKPNPSVCAHGMRARYVAPIDYGDKQKISLQQSVGEWLVREKSDIDPRIILQKIHRQELQERMNTGLMFNMIMKMLISESSATLEKRRRPRGYEIYKSSIIQELEHNWSLLFASDRLENKIEVLTQELVQRNSPSSQVQEISLQKDVLLTCLEDLAEKIATFLLQNNRNRLSFNEIEQLLYQT